MIEIGTVNLFSNDTLEWAKTFYAHDEKTLADGKEKLKEIAEMQRQLTAEDFGSASKPIVDRIANRLEICRNYVEKTTKSFEGAVSAAKAGASALAKAREQNKKRLFERSEAIKKEREVSRAATAVKAEEEKESALAAVDEEKKKRGRPRKAA